MSANLVFVAFAAISYYLTLKYEHFKIPIPCLGCDTGKNTFWKCAKGTGYGSTSCNKKKQYDKYIMDGLEVNQDINKFVLLLNNMIQNEIPGVIYKNVKLIVDKIEVLRNQILSKFVNIYDLLVEEMFKLKDVIVLSVKAGWQNFKTNFIDPIIAKIIKFIVYPIKQVFLDILKFKKLLIDSLKAGINQLIGMGRDFLDHIYLEIERNLLKPFEDLSNAACNMLSDALNLVKSGMIGSVVDAYNGLTNSIEFMINKVGDGMEEGVNFASKGMNVITGGVNKASVELSKGLHRTVRGITNSAERPMNMIAGGLRNVGNSFNIPIFPGSSSGSVIYMTPCIIPGVAFGCCSGGRKLKGWGWNSKCFRISFPCGLNCSCKSTWDCSCRTIWCGSWIGCPAIYCNMTRPQFGGISIKPLSFLSSINNVNLKVNINFKIDIPKIPKVNIPALSIPDMVSKQHRDDMLKVLNSKGYFPDVALCKSIPRSINKMELNLDSKKGYDNRIYLNNNSSDIDEFKIGNKIYIDFNRGEGDRGPYIIKNLINDTANKQVILENEGYIPRSFFNRIDDDPFNIKFEIGNNKGVKVKAENLNFAKNLDFNDTELSKFSCKKKLIEKYKNLSIEQIKEKLFEEHRYYPKKPNKEDIVLNEPPDLKIPCPKVPPIPNPFTPIIIEANKIKQKIINLIKALLAPIKNSIDALILLKDQIILNIKKFFIRFFTPKSIIRIFKMIVSVFTDRFEDSWKIIKKIIKENIIKPISSQFKYIYSEIKKNINIIIKYTKELVYSVIENIKSVILLIAGEIVNFIRTIIIYFVGLLLIIIYKIIDYSLFFLPIDMNEKVLLWTSLLYFYILGGLVPIVLQVTNIFLNVYDDIINLFDKIVRSFIDLLKMIRLPKLSKS